MDRQERIDTLNELNRLGGGGGDTRYPHALCATVLYTPGTKAFAEAGGAFWLLDIIATVQRKPRVAAESFQKWQLTVRPDETAVITCGDGNGNVVYRKRIHYTDFPLPEFTLWVCDRVILLPCEY
jgi:hypothetical protein